MLLLWILFWHCTIIISIAEAELVEYVLNTGDHTSSMRYWVRWTDYGESDEEGSSRHTTTTYQEAAWTIPGWLLQMWGNRPHCMPVPSPYPTEPNRSATHKKPIPLDHTQIWLGRLSRTHGLNCDLNHAEPWWTWGPQFHWFTKLFVLTSKTIWRTSRTTRAH